MRNEGRGAVDSASDSLTALPLIHFSAFSEILVHHLAMHVMKAEA